MHVVVERREEDGEINQQIWLHKRQEEMKEERCNDMKEKKKNTRTRSILQQTTTRKNNNTFILLLLYAYNVRVGTITKPQDTNVTRSLKNIRKR